MTLRLVATYADAWNTFGPVDNFARKAAVARLLEAARS